MPSPAKERFVIGFARPAGVPVAVGVGGSFDVLAGKVRRAPRWLQRVGLEWLFRMAQEPRRLAGRYATTNLRFGWLLVRALVDRRRGHDAT
jgi:N-acetylglucosaminyldiphosphoundecaprenol N-acetyl-beta-D-mannosaminyltransferase